MLICGHYTPEQVAQSGGIPLAAAQTLVHMRWADPSLDAIGGNPTPPERYELERAAMVWFVTVCLQEPLPVRLDHVTLYTRRMKGLKTYFSTNASERMQ